VRFWIEKEDLEKLGAKDQRDIWCSALRSGDWDQIQGSMCDIENPKSACCLNVAAISVDGAKRIDHLRDDYPRERFKFANTARHFNLIKKSDYGVISTEPFTELNDVCKLTLDEIADVVDGKVVSKE